jgi:hypothetical protein
VGGSVLLIIDKNNPVKKVVEPRKQVMAQKASKAKKALALWCSKKDKALPIILYLSLFVDRMEK